MVFTSLPLKFRETRFAKNRSNGTVQTRVVCGNVPEARSAKINISAARIYMTVGMAANWSARASLLQQAS